jgi:hypothetical protein
MEVTAVIELTRQELWDLIESLPEGKTTLHEKLRGARGTFEGRYQVYGNGAKIKPKSPALEALNARLNEGMERITSSDSTDLF